MRVLIFGATGNIGRHVREAALGAGHDLVLFARDPAKLEPLEEGEMAIAGDVADSASVSAAVDGIDAVISVLGPRSNSPEQEAVFVGFARALVDSMTRRGVRRLVALSGAAVRVPGEDKRPLDRLASLVIGKAVRHVVRPSSVSSTSSPRATSTGSHRVRRASSTARSPGSTEPAITPSGRDRASRRRTWPSSSSPA